MGPEMNVKPQHHPSHQLSRLLVSTSEPTTATEVLISTYLHLYSHLPDDMSGFNKELSSFGKQLQAQAALMPKRAVGAGNNNNNNLKRKEPPAASAVKKVNEVYSQPADTSLSQSGSYMTQVHYVVQHLREKETARTAKEIQDYLGYPLNETLKFLLRKNERIHYDPRSDTFIFRPVHNIRNKEALVAYLREMGTTTAQGLTVKELKEGWAGAEDAIKQLEAEREILVTRTKKDNQPRMVWINDKTLDLDVDEGMFLQPREHLSLSVACVV